MANPGCKAERIKMEKKKRHGMYREERLDNCCL
jgi:hypothetical protein